jgi:hypothetical protein
MRRTSRGRDPLDLDGQTRHLGFMVYAAARLASRSLAIQFSRVFIRERAARARWVRSRGKPTIPLNRRKRQ